MPKKFFSVFASILALCLNVATALGQTADVKGIVIDDEGEPVFGAAVIVSGTNIGAVTDMDGAFTLHRVPSSATSFDVTCLGYVAQVVPYTSNNLHITLAIDRQMLDDVVVTAMGITKSEKSLGYAATTLKSDELAEAHNTNVVSSLAGKVAGVQVTSANNDPGSASNIIIRGFSSINGSNQPLYVVDGVPISNYTSTSWGHSITLGGISSISSEDIESMTILKGAAATALYGSRAANGVVLVTTKTGKANGERNFSIEYNGGIQLRQLNNMAEFQNDFGQGWNGVQTYIENGSWGPALDGSLQVYGPIYDNSQLLHTYSAKKSNFEDFFEIGVSHNHNIAFSGVSSDHRTEFYLSYSYTADDGIMPSDADKYTRNTISSRMTYTATNWLKISANMNFSTTKTDIVGSYQGTSVIDGLYEMPRDVTIVDMKDTSSPFYNPQAYYTPYGITNPYWAIENNYNHTNAKKIIGKVQVDAKPIKELTLTYRFGFDYGDYDRKVGYPQINVDDTLINEDYGYSPTNMNQEGYVYAQYGRNYETNHDFLANYTKDFGKWEINATAGLNINERYSTYMYAETDDLTFETGFWQLSNGSTVVTPGEYQTKRRLVGLFGDVTVGYNDMIYLDVTARNDWSSTLPVGNNGYFYPGVTGSWIFSELLDKDNVLSYGKLRVAYGMTGNDASAYLVNPSYTQASSGVYYYGTISFPVNGTNSFVASSTAGSSDLKPEMTKEFEVGADVRFLKGGRIGLEGTYYNRTTSDQIFTLPVDPATGYSYMVTNFGDVKNEGYELVLSTVPVRTKNIEWDLDINFSQNFNKVKTMPESLEGGKVTIYSFAAGSDAIYMYAEEGKPMGRYYTYLPQYTEDGKIIVDEYGQPVLGDELEDTGKDMNHKWTGGLSTSLRLWDFTLSATFDVRYGGYMFSRTANLMQFTGNGIVTTYNNRNPFVIPNSVYYDEETGEYVENTTPIYQSDGSYQEYYDSYGYGKGGEQYLVDRSFAKLRNITLTWNLPRKWVKAIKFSDISVSAYCNNVFTWVASDNYYVDPESSTTGTDLSGMFGELYTNPNCRIWGFNLNLKF